MINCKDVTRLAGDALDGTLGWRQRLSLRAHLFVCVNCRRYVDQLRTTLAVVRDRRWAGSDAAGEDALAAMFRNRGKDDGSSSFTCT